MKRSMKEGEEEEEEVAINGDCKRNRTESDVDDFFALLERMRKTEKELGIAQKIRRPEAPAAMSKKPAWHLSFQWEDFSGEKKEGFGCRQSNLCAKWWPVCLDQQKGKKEMLDLNLPSSLY